MKKSSVIIPVIGICAVLFLAKMKSEDNLYFEIRKNTDTSEPETTRVIITEIHEEDTAENNNDVTETNNEHRSEFNSIRNIEFSSPLAEEVYYTICSSLAEIKSDIHIDGEADSTVIKEAVRIIRKENPEFFWVSGYTCTSDGTYIDISFDIEPCLNGRDLSEMYTELQNAADEIIRKIPDNYSDYEKALFVHDSIINSAEYDSDGRDTGTFGLWSTGYGCLIENKAVCQGYAEAFKLIMNKLGIECGIVSGKGKNEDHAWNYIKLGEEYYWVDLTWDDPLTSDGSQILQHNYCFLDDRFLVTHTPDDTNLFIPECSSMKYNYYSYNGTYAESYSFEDIDRILSSTGENEYAEIMFGSSEAADECINDLFENKMIWKTERAGKSEKRLSYSYDPDISTLKIIFKD